MLNIDSDSLECDLAQTYQIYDMRALSPKRIAAFASGLGEDSRIVKALTGQRYPLSVLLQAAQLDALNALIWSKCSPDTPKPSSVLNTLLGQQSEPQKRGYEDPEEFEKALSLFREGVDAYG